jgi:toluene monooxygenase system ferredoxin subunit
MGFVKVCTLDDLWEGDMEAFDVEGQRILLVHLPGGEVRATQVECPHQQGDLTEGLLDGTSLTCSVHLWEFDVMTCQGINPKHPTLANYPVKIDGDDIYVDPDGDTPKYAHS